MAGSDISDDHSIRTCRPGKISHLSKVAYAHLKDSNLMLIRDPEDSEGKTQIVIEISCCLQNVILLSEN